MSLEMKFMEMWNNLKVEDVNHEQNLDSVYVRSEFKHDICKKCWKQTDCYVNLFALDRVHMT